MPIFIVQFGVSWPGQLDGEGVFRSVGQASAVFADQRTFPDTCSSVLDRNNLEQGGLSCMSFLLLALALFPKAES